MTRLQLGGWVVALGLLAGTGCADDPRRAPADPAEALIDQLVEVADPDVGYSGSVSGTAFLPLGRREAYTGLFGQRPNVASDALQSLVRLGVRGVPALLAHLSDDRRTRIVVEHTSIIGGLFVSQDKGEQAEEKFGEGFEAGTRYTVRVGDLCYVALGQIVNREYTAVRYQPTAIVFATCVPKSKQLREGLHKEWGGLTEDRHRASLARDLGSDREDLREGAALRLAYYYPAALQPLALDQLARPTYDVLAVDNLVRRRLYPAASAQERQALVDAFVAQHGEIARDGIRWQLFDDLKTQESDEEGRLFPKLDPKYKARECLIEVFGLPANVKSTDRPKAQPLANSTQARFVRTLLYDRGERLDRAVRDLLAKTDDDALAQGCLDRLVGRGYDADIEAYLNRRLPKLNDRDRKELEVYRAKLGWTRLHAAVDLGVPELIAAALEDRPAVDARGRDGRTALHLAAAAGMAEAVGLLLDAKADPNVPDGRGRLAVQLASFADHPDTVRRLVAGRSRVPDVFTAATVGDAARLGELLQGDGGLVKSRNEPGYTPLDVAAREGHEAAVRTLIEAGADVNAVDAPAREFASPDGWTPLHLAVMAGKARTAKLLLDKGADVNAADRREKLTPLHYAAWAGDAEVVKVLLGGKADRGAKDEQGRTPLDLAKERKHAAVVKLLEGFR